MYFKLLWVIDHWMGFNYCFKVFTSRKNTSKENKHRSFYYSQIQSFKNIYNFWSYQNYKTAPGQFILIKFTKHFTCTCIRYNQVNITLLTTHNFGGTRLNRYGVPPCHWHLTFINQASLLACSWAISVTNHLCWRRKQCNTAAKLRCHCELGKDEFLHSTNESGNGCIPNRANLPFRVSKYFENK